MITVSVVTLKTLNVICVFLLSNFIQSYENHEIGIIPKQKSKEKKPAPFKS